MLQTAEKPKTKPVLKKITCGCTVLIDNSEAYKEINVFLYDGSRKAIAEELKKSSYKVIAYKILTSTMAKDE